VRQNLCPALIEGADRLVQPPCFVREVAGILWYESGGLTTKICAHSHGADAVMRLKCRGAAGGRSVRREHGAQRLVPPQAHARGPARAEREVNILSGFEDFCVKNGSSRGQHLALTVLCVPNFLENGPFSSS